MVETPCSTHRGRYFVPVKRESNKQAGAANTRVAFSSGPADRPRREFVWTTADRRHSNNVCDQVDGTNQSPVLLAQPATPGQRSADYADYADYADKAYGRMVPAVGYLFGQWSCTL